MGSKLEWVFSMLDRMSGPADRIFRSLNRIDNATKALGQRARDPVTGRFLKGGGVSPSAFNSLAGAFGKSADGSGMLAKGAGLAAAAVTGLALATVAAGAAALAAGASFAFHFLTFKEDAIAAFSAMTGSDDAAKRIFDKAVKFASVTPFKESEVVAMTQTLVTKGFKEGELDNLMKGVGDVGALLGTDKMNGVMNALGKMRSQQKLTMDSMQQLSDSGINQALVYDSLGKQLGKTRPEIERMISAGQVSDAQGIAAAMDAIKNGLSGGELGGGMAKASQTIHGLMSTLAGRPEALLAHADFEPMMGPMRDFIKLLNATLAPDTPLGHRITALFETIGKDVGEIFGILNGLDMTKVFETVLAVLEPIVKMVTSFGKGGMTVLVAAFTWLSEKITSLSPDQIDKLSRAAEVMGEAMVVTLGIIGALVLAVLAIPLAIIYAATSVWDELNAMWSEIRSDGQWKQIGVDIIVGVMDGMLSMSSPLTDMFNRITGVKDAPSAWSVLTKDAPAGDAGGAVSPTPGGSNAAVSTSPTAPPVTVQMTGDIVVQGAELGDDPKAHGKAAAGSFKAELASQLGAMGLSFGG